MKNENLDTSTEIRMYVLREAAIVLGVAQRILRERIKKGEIRVMPWGNEKRIPAWELKRWQDTQLELNSPDHAIEEKVQQILHRERPQRYAGRRAARV
jgi:hypothetical protein